MDIAKEIKASTTVTIVFAFECCVNSQQSTVNSPQSAVNIRRNFRTSGTCTVLGSCRIFGLLCIAPLFLFSYFFEKECKE